MSQILPLAEAFLFEKALTGNMIFSNRSKAGVMMLAFALVSLIAALILVIVGVYHGLTLRYSPDVAAMTAAGMVFMLAAIFALVGYAMIKEKRSRLKTIKDEVTGSFMDLFDTVAEELQLPDAIRNHPKTTIAVSTLVGYLIAKRVL